MKSTPKTSGNVMHENTEGWIYSTEP